jgi:protein involved in temperature-dependent protein secretion
VRGAKTIVSDQLSPVVITDPAAYWKLRALTQDVAAAEADAMKAAQRHRQICEQKAAVAQGYMRELATTFPGLDPAIAYRWDDATCTLTPVDTTTE